MSKKVTLVLALFIVGGASVWFLRNTPYTNHQRARRAFNPGSDESIKKVALKDFSVKYFKNEIRVLALIHNITDRPVKKIKLHYKIYEDNETRRKIVERMVWAQWEQPELREAKTPREKRKIAGVLPPGKSVTVRMSLFVPTDIPKVVRVRPGISVSGAEFAENL